jgi:DNA-binding CsgD family transcriptional regulator
MAMPAPAAILDEFLRIAHVGVDRHEYARASARVLKRVVPFDGVAAVWFDAATGVPVDTWADNVLDEVDVAGLRQLAASGRRAARLSEAMQSHESGDELRVVYAGDTGLWCAGVMYREPGAPNFAVREVDLLASLTSDCTDLQRVRLERDLSVDAGESESGLLLLDDEDGVEMSNAAASDWLDELRPDGRRLPLVVTAVARRAREIDAGDSDGVATARARTASGRWAVVRGWVLANGTDARTAVTLEPARAPELAELVAEVHGLTARERHVTELVAQGLSNAAIAAQLYLSTYTVQDHLKAIFEKLDVSSRGQLVARLFVDRYQGSPAA